MLHFFLPFFQPPPLDLYHFAAQPLAYAEGYTLNLDFASDFARLHNDGLVGTFAISLLGLVPETLLHKSQVLLSGTYLHSLAILIHHVGFHGLSHTLLHVFH